MEHCSTLQGRLFSGVSVCVGGWGGAGGGGWGVFFFFFFGHELSKRMVCLHFHPAASTITEHIRDTSNPRPWQANPSINARCPPVEIAG